MFLGAEGLPVLCDSSATTPALGAAVACGSGPEGKHREGRGRGARGRLSALRRPDSSAFSVAGKTIPHKVFPVGCPARLFS